MLSFRARQVNESSNIAFYQKSNMVMFLLRDDPSIRGSGHGGSRLRVVFQTSSSPAMLSSSPWEILRHSQVRLHVELLQWFLVPPWGLLPVGRAWYISQERRPGDILTRCLNDLRWILSIWRRGHYSTMFWQRPMASDLEALTVIPNTSYSAANQPKTLAKQCHMYFEVPKPDNLLSHRSCPWKSQTGSETRDNPDWRPKPIGNVLSLWSYRDWIAWSKRPGTPVWHPVSWSTTSGPPS